MPTAEETNIKEQIAAEEADTLKETEQKPEQKMEEKEPEKDALTLEKEAVSKELEQTDKELEEVDVAIKEADEYIAGKGEDVDPEALAEINGLKEYADELKTRQEELKVKIAEMGTENVQTEKTEAEILDDKKEQRQKELRKADEPEYAVKLRAELQKEIDQQLQRLNKNMTGEEYDRRAGELKRGMLAKLLKECIKNGDIELGLSKYSSNDYHPEADYNLYVVDDIMELDTADFAANIEKLKQSFLTERQQKDLERDFYDIHSKEKKTPYLRERQSKGILTKKEKNSITYIEQNPDMIDRVQAERGRVQTERERDQKIYHFKQKVYSDSEFAKKVAAYLESDDLYRSKKNKEGKYTLSEDDFADLTEHFEDDLKK